MTDPSSSNTLLPCPFCGGKAGIHRSHDADGMLWVGVRCQGCGAASTQDWCSPGNDCPIFYEGIRNSWNRRPAHEPSARQCNHGAISPKGTMFYHGFVDPKANMWRCDVCNGVFEGNLTDPSTPGSQALTLVGPSEPPPAVDVAPIAKLTVRDGLVQRAGLYAPGLPDGDHDVFPVPLSPKGELRPHVLAEPPSGWRPIETAPKDREVLFWVVPLSAEETYRDTSGNPITSGAQPRVMFCRFGRWSSLSKATHWADVPTGCPSETKDAGECGACDKPGEHCANVHGICSRHGGRAHEPSAGVKCTHCNGKGYNEPIYDEQDGWIDETPCETCNGSGRITTVEQYLKTLPANWHEDSSLETWFPITAEELKRLKDARATVPPSVDWFQRTVDAECALVDARRYVEAYEPKSVSEAHDRDLMLGTISAITTVTKEESHGS